MICKCGKLAGRKSGQCRTCYCREWYQRHKKSESLPRKHHNKSAGLRIKLLAFDHYGHECKCCGEDIIYFLTIDHIDGGGQQQRKELGNKVIGTKFYWWLKNNNYPAGFQTLCRNCNWGKHVLGICPHQINKETNGEINDTMGTIRARQSLV